jgi:hypothetical protein
MVINTEADFREKLVLLSVNRSMSLQSTEMERSGESITVRRGCE